MPGKKSAPGKNKQSQAFREKVAKTMREFREGQLYTSSGHKVTNRRQALAIALSTAMRYESGPTVHRTWGGVTGTRPQLKTSWANTSKKGNPYTVHRKNPHHKSTGSARAAEARGEERKKKRKKS